MLDEPIRAGVPPRPPATSLLLGHPDCGEQLVKPATTGDVVRRFSVAGAGAMGRSGLWRTGERRQQLLKAPQPRAPLVDASLRNV
jgi:hypothetical protein